MKRSIARVNERPEGVWPPTKWVNARADYNDVATESTLF